jgi:glutaconate CoA-transferase subunit B
MSAPAYKDSELLICLASRLVEDGSMAFIGTGIPMLAASLAQRLHAPNLVPVFEFGGVGAVLEKLPLAVGDMRTFNKALFAASICEVMETGQRGFIEYGFIGGAQIDAYGNLNTTVIGPQDKPKVRLPGSGGANDIGSSIWRTIIIMKQDKKKFVEKIDFITTPGYLTGLGAREKAGLPPGCGPYRVVTNLGVMGFDEATCRMKLLALNPGVTVQQVRDNTGFELLVADHVEQNPPPSVEELRVLREQVDPDGLYR